MKKVKIINGVKLKIDEEMLHKILYIFDIEYSYEVLMKDETLYANCISAERTEYLAIKADTNKETFNFGRFSINSIVVKMSSRFLYFIKLNNRKELIKLLNKYSKMKAFI